MHKQFYVGGFLFDVVSIESQIEKDHTGKEHNAYLVKGVFAEENEKQLPKQFQTTLVKTWDCLDKINWKVG